MQSFEYVCPQNLEDVSRLLKQADGRACVLAGGTQLLIDMQQGVVQPSLVIDIKYLPRLRDIRFSLDDGLTIGAAVTMTQLMNHADVRRHYPMLVEAVRSIRAPQIRNRATVGGNVCDASPASELAAALLCYDAVCSLVELKGERTLALHRFFLGNGRTALTTGEVLADLNLPTPWAEAAGSLHRIGRGKGDSMTLAGAASFAQSVDGGLCNWRVALVGVAPCPLRAYRAEHILNDLAADAGAIEKAVAAVQDAAEPASDVHASAQYRLALAGIMARRSIMAVLAALRKGAP